MYLYSAKLMLVHPKCQSILMLKNVIYDYQFFTSFIDFLLSLSYHNSDNCHSFLGIVMSFPLLSLLPLGVRKSDNHFYRTLLYGQYYIQFYGLYNALAVLKSELHLKMKKTML